ncbi:hypothetical protein ACERIT_03300 [Halopenitus sp. H-Gu1]|uniref:hypothetical protein n=1 Tax=Halopenitus sp. H-Gu1 TaxID=3242697 RepID=UPI00359EF64C
MTERETETVTVPREVIERYPRFSLYNSPYPAHDRGYAIDLYPGTGIGISPVDGVVRETRTVGCPDRQYASDHDHVIVVDVDAGWSGAAGVDRPLTARILHVDPAVRSGDRISVGDPLGSTVRSGFFGRWVDDHVHLEFREREANPFRASGSIRVAADIDVEPVPWNGRGTVIETGPAHALLDAPAESVPDREYAAVASDEGMPIDGGLTHYAGGGALSRDVRDGSSRSDGDVGQDLSLLGRRIGTASGRNVSWTDVDVLANGERITGMSLFVARGSSLGVKLVCPDRHFEIGTDVRVSIRESRNPIRLDVGQ